jgi:hypothetical protein
VRTSDDEAHSRASRFTTDGRRDAATARAIGEGKGARRQRGHLTTRREPCRPRRVAAGPNSAGSASPGVGEEKLTFRASQDSDTTREAKTETRETMTRR